MATSSPPRRSPGSRFPEILSQIPANVPRLHHGRSPQEGFDCVGLVVWVYHQIGINIGDFEYEESQAELLNRAGEIQKALGLNLRDVTSQVQAGIDRDGDIWLFATPDGLMHAAVQCQGLVWHMCERLHRRGTRHIRALMQRAYRI